MAAYNWTPEEKQQFFNQYGFYPEQFRGDAHTLPGAPRYDEAVDILEEGLNTPVEGLVPSVPLVLPRNVEFDETDVQAMGQQEADEFRTFAAKSQQERDAILDREYNQTSRLANLASVFGVNVNLPQRRSSSSAVDPAKGMASSAANRIFTENLLKKVREVGGKLTDTEVSEFLLTQNAGPEQIKIMKDMKDWVDIGDLKTLVRYNSEENKIEYLYRYPNEITPELREAGWKDNVDEAYKYGRELRKDKKEEDKIERLTEIQSLITSLAPYKPQDHEGGEITWIPQTEEEYQKLKQQWGIKLPEAEALLREQLGIAEPGKVSTYAYTKEGGKQAILNLTPRQYADAIRSDKYPGLVPYDIYGKELIAEQNELISNLAASETQRTTNTELDGKMITPLSLLQFQQHALEQWKETGRPLRDIKRFNEQSAAAFRGEQKKLERYNSDLSVIMGQLPSYDSWEDYANKTKGMDNESVIKGAEELERRKGDEWKYTLNRVLFNAEGKPLDIDNYAEYLQAQDDGYKYVEYNDAPDRPIPIASERTWFEVPDQATDLVPVKVKIEKNGKEEVAIIFVHNINAEQNRVSTAKTDLDADIAAYEAVNEKIDSIFSQLESGEGLSQMAAIRALEKLQDPTGVIRESDVALMKSAMGTLWDDLARLGVIVFERKPKPLSDQESDQVANTAMVALEVIQRHLKLKLDRKKDQFTNDPYTTWTSKGKDKISFDRVIGADMFKKYTTLKLPKYNFRTERFGGSKELTPDEKKDDIEGLMPGISSIYELVK